MEDVQRKYENTPIFTISRKKEKTLSKPDPLE